MKTITSKEPFQLPSNDYDDCSSKGHLTSSIDRPVSEMMVGANTPHCSTIFRRIQKLDVQVDGKKVMVADKDKKIVMAVDATGIKQQLCSGYLKRSKPRIRKDASWLTSDAKESHWQ